MTPDSHWMRRAIELASRGGRLVRPNPQVGAVLVSADGTVLGEGWHQQFGGPHAEVNAIAAAGRQEASTPGDLSSATLYVTLEPCSHFGKTPPCSDLVIREGIGRVVVGSSDPNPSVSGRGIEQLRAAGISVEIGVMEAECRELNPGFLTRMTLGRPWVFAKVAQSLDGFVAPRRGTSRWITGEAARNRVHWMRAEADALLTGTGTILADDPALTVRHVEGPQPGRVILDRTGAVPSTAQVLSDGTPTLVFTGQEAQPKGGTVVRVSETEHGLDLPEVLQHLGALHHDILMVEAGPTLTSAMIRAGLVDELRIFTAPILLGGGKPSFLDPARETLSQALRGTSVRYEQIGVDILTTLTLREI